ncbi:AraC family transcriptional regulator [Pedobacter ginsengisoli]|uniref:AraC family transcriptional regulator n=1 Tax=Pedobacter ginsengisoli TaxID=363852 RepID=UPI00254AFD5B|nr:AraC family transcriptional regulator [Pedobacter ginsengisoli]
MKRYRQFKPILISAFEVEQWHHPAHTHNHYELIYIKNGSGIHHINKLTVIYQEGDIFLLGPSEEHYFEIEQKTKFIYLKFTDLYMQGSQDAWHHPVKELEYLVHNRESHLSGFKLTANDQLLTAQIFNVIELMKLDPLLNERLIWQQLISLSVILKRNLFCTMPDQIGENKMEAMFSYIHENIYTPERLRSAVMAADFNTTINYIGRYFKRNAGVSLRSYIKSYRHTLISKRMQAGNYSLKQIAAEFGLADESHVHKLMRQ